MKLQLARAKALLSQKNPDLDKVVETLEPLLKRKNTAWPVFHYMGIVMLQKKKHEPAAGYFLKAIEAGSDEPETDHLLSVSFFHLEQFDEAEEYAKKAVSKRDDFFKAWLNLGSVYKAQARLNDALKCYQKANQLDPRSAGVAFRIASIYNDQGNLKKALELFDITLKIDPGYVEALCEKARIFRKKQKFDEAKKCLDEALNINSRNLEALVEQGELYKEQGEFEQAVAHYEQILADFPGISAIRVNYALCLQALGRFDESEENYQAALEKQPDLSEALSNYLMGLHYNPKRSKNEIFEAHLNWDEQLKLAQHSKRPVPDNIDENRRLRIGFISGGFRRHPVGWMITRALENLPKEQFEIYCYTTNNVFDSITERIHNASDVWRSIIGYNDEVAADMIRNDSIDILVELSGHAGDNRLKTVALEPAPIIVKWVGGLFNTTGLKSVDYLLSDWYETPAGDEPYYTEKLVRMPDDYVCFLPPEYAPEVDPLPANKKGYITFGCFNNPTKVNPVLLEQWAEIMNRVPDSRLFLKSKQYASPSFTGRIVEQMEKLGISEDRLIFEGHSLHKELLDSYNNVDIALDPWPYSGGLSTCEALWMGVPVITLPGPTFAGRHSTTHVINAGFPEWVAENREDYIEKAVKLAGDLEMLAKLRRDLRSRVANSPLCDGKRFGINLSAAFREIWKQRVAGYKNEIEDWQDHIDVKDLSEAITSEEKVPKQEADSAKNSGRDNNSNSYFDQDTSSLNKKKGEILSMGEDDDLSENIIQNGVSSGLNGHQLHTNGENGHAEILQGSIPVHENDTYKIKTKDGVTVCTPADLNLLTPYVLLEQQAWFEPETAFVNQYMQPGMKGLDIGAAFGVYALPMAQKVGSEGRVYSFEPGSLARKYLEKSKNENGFDHLEVIEQALSDETGNALLQTAGTPELNQLNENGAVPVYQTTLDEWWKSEGEPELDFIKLDVNGHEEMVLAGADNLLDQTSPVILFTIGEGGQQVENTVTRLVEKGFQLFEYVPGPELLTKHDPTEPHDPYLVNLIAVKEDRQEKLKKQGWFHNEEIEPKEPDAATWKTYLGELPWTDPVLAGWEHQVLSPQNREYMRALDYLCAAEMMGSKNKNKGNVNHSSKKAVLMLGAAQHLIRIYNNGNTSIAVALTLTRVLNALGKRGQAVDVIHNVMEQSMPNQKNLSVDLPFLPPLPEQDRAAVKTDFSKWLMVRVVEAWLQMRDYTSFLSGEKERKFYRVLEENPETLPWVDKKIDLLSQKESPGSILEQNKNSKQNGKFIHLCFNHVYAQSLSDLIEYVNENSEQEHLLFIEKRRAIAGFSAEIKANKHSAYFDFEQQLQAVIKICCTSDVDAVFIHGLFFDWQKQVIKQIASKKHIAWKFWGGDLYNPIKNGNPFHHLMEHINSVHSMVEGDFEIIKKTYGIKQECRFGYTFPGLYGELPEITEKNQPPLIIIGNSGDRTNNHAEILKMLSEKPDIKDYRLLLPIAYNLNPGYREELIGVIKKTGLEQVTRLHESFIHPDEYVQLMMRAGMLITAHNRQQAIGNILTSIYSGNNTFLKNEIILNGEKIKNPTWQFLEDHQLEGQAYGELCEMERLSDIEKLREQEIAENQSKIKEQFGIEVKAKGLIESCSQILEKELTVQE